MPFILGFLFGAAGTFIVTCIIASKKIDEARMEGYLDGKDDALHKIDRGIKE